MTRRLLTLALGAALLVGGGPVTALPASAADPVVTTTTLTPLPATSTPVGSVELRAVVAAGSGVPTGTVTFQAIDDPAGTDVDVPLADGVTTGSSVAVSTTVTVPSTAGDPEYRATYVPTDAAFVGSSDTAEVAVRRSVDVAVTVPTTPVRAGTLVPVTLTATDSDEDPVAGEATVTIGARSPTSHQLPASGTVSFDVDSTGLAPGTVDVTVAFTPDEAQTYADAAGPPTSFLVGRVPTVTLSADPAVTDPLAGESLRLTAVVATGGHGVPAGSVVVTRTGDTGPGETVQLTEPPAVHGTDSATVTVDVTPPVAGPATYVATYVPAAGSPLVTAEDTVLLEVDPRPYDALVDFEPETAVLGRDDNAVSVTVTDDDGGAAVEVDESSALRVGTVTVDLDWEDGVGTGTFDPAETGDVDVELDVVPADGAYAARTFGDQQVAVIRGTTTSLTPASASPRLEDALPVLATVTASGGVQPTGTVQIVSVTPSATPGGPATEEVVASALLSANTAPGVSSDSVEIMVPTDVIDARSYLARYLPDTDSAALLAGSDSPGPLTQVTPVHRSVALALAVAGTPRVDVPTTVTVTAEDEHDGRPIARTSSTLTIGGDTVTLDWDDATGTGTGDWTPSAGGAREVELAFRPAGASYDATQDVTPDLDDVTVLDDTETELAVSTTSPLIDSDVTLTATVTATGDDAPTGQVAFTANGGSPVYVALEPSATDPVSTASLTITPGSDLELSYAAAYEPATGPQTHAASSVAATAATTISPRKRSLTVLVGVPAGAHRVGTDAPVTITVKDADDAARTFTIASATLTANGVTTGVGTIDWSGHPVGEVDYRPTTTGTKTLLASIVPGDTGVYNTPATDTEVLVVKRDQSPTASVPTGTHLAGSTVAVTVADAFDDDGLQVLPKPPTAPDTAEYCEVATTTPTITVTLTRGPTCTVSITASGDGEHFAATVDLPITVTPRPVEVDVTVTPLESEYGETVLVAAEATEAGQDDPLDGTGVVSVHAAGDPAGAVAFGSFDYGDPEGVVVSGLTTRLDADEYVAVVTYLPPSTLTGVLEETEGQLPFTVDQTSQELTFGDPSDVLFVDETWVDAARNVTDPGASGDIELTVDEDVSVTADGLPTCTVVADTQDVEFLRPGPCRVDAEAPPSTNYLLDTDAVTVTVAPRPLDASLTVTDVSTPGALRYGDDLQVEVTLTDRLDPTLTVPVEGTGTIRIVGYDAAASVLDPLEADDSALTRTFSPTKIDGHRVEVTFTPDPIGDVERFGAIGATDPVLPTGAFDVERGLQVIRWRGELDSDASLTASAYADEPWDPQVTGGDSGEQVELVPVDDEVCDVVDGAILVLSAPAGETCRVTATQGGGDFYEDAPASHLVLTPHQRPVSAAVTTSAVPTYGATLTVTVTATDARLAADHPNAADPATRFDGTGTLTLLRGGSVVGTPIDLTYDRGVATTTDVVAPQATTYTLRATFVPSRPDVYDVASVPDATLVMAPARQEILFADLPDDPNVGTTWDPDPEGGPSGQPVEMAVETPAVCEKVRTGAAPTPDLEILPVRFLLVSQDCVLTFEQDGDDRYAPTGEIEVRIRVERRKVLLTPTADLADLDYESAVQIDLAATAKRAPGGSVAGETEVVVREVSDPAHPAPPSSDGELTFDSAAGTARQYFAGQTLVEGSYAVTFTFTPDDEVNWEAEPLTVPFSVALAPQTVDLLDAPPAPALASKSWTPTFTVPSDDRRVVLRTGDVDDPTDLDDYDRLDPADRPTATCATSDSPDDANLLDETIAFLATGPCEVLAWLPAVPGRYSASADLPLEVDVTRIPSAISIVVPPAAPRWPTVDEDILVSAVALADGRFGDGSGTFGLERRNRTTGTWEQLPDLTGDSDEWFGGGNFASFTAELAGDYRVTATFDPADPVVFAGDSADGAFTIDEASQPIVVATTPPTTAKVRETWTGSATGGASGQDVHLEVDTTLTDPIVPAPTSGIAPYACRAEGLVLRFEGRGDCVFSFVQDGVTDRYLEGRSPAYTIAVERTDTQLVIDPRGPLTVGVPATITVRASAGSSPVPGGGTIALRSPDGSTPLSPLGGAWVNGVGTYAFTPQEAGAELRIGVDFTPTDTAAFTTLTGTDRVSRTVDVASGTPVITLASAQGRTAWVDDSWTPGATASNGRPVQLAVTPTGSPACTLGTGTVTFATAGDCEVRATVDAVGGGYGRPTWNAAAPVVQPITVKQHPVRITLSTPVPLVYDTDIAMTAQVVGYPRDGALPAGVPGVLTFLVDGEPAPGVAPATISGDGTAARTLRVLRASAEPDSDALDRHTISARFVPDPGYRNTWKADDVGATHLFARRTEDVLRDPDTPGTPLLVGQSWTPVVETPSERPVVVSAEPAQICTSDGATVTVVGSTAAGGTCAISYAVAGTTVYAPIPASLAVSADTGLRPVTVEVTAGSRVINQPVAVTAQVTAPAYEPVDAHTTALAATHPSGSVTFTVSGTDVSQTVPVDADGRASFSGYTPTTAEARTVTATFEATPAGAGVASRTFAGDAATAALPIGRVPTETTLPTVTPTTVTARVLLTERPASVLGGEVSFAWAPVGAPTAQTTLGTGTVDAQGWARVPATAIPADQDVVITARYGGDRDHAPDDVEYHRALPTLTATTDRPLTGWQTRPVRITYTCTWPSPAVATSCPAPVELTADQSDRSVAATVSTTDGGTATARVTGINIDRTDPTVDITGVGSGQRFLGSLPDVGCRTTDQTSGSTCSVRLSPAIDQDDLYAGPVTATATARDAAGNTRSTQVDFIILQAWVAKAPDVRGGFQVKRRARVKIQARTEGAQPQLMLPGAKGKLAPSQVFRATRVNDGIVTWVVSVSVPKRIGVGDDWTIGYRLSDAPRKIIRLRLDVVRAPGRRPGARES